MLVNCSWPAADLIVICYWPVTVILVNCYWPVTDTLVKCFWLLWKFWMQVVDLTQVTCVEMRFIDIRKSDTNTSFMQHLFWWDISIKGYIRHQEGPWLVTAIHGTIHPNFRYPKWKMSLWTQGNHPARLSLQYCWHLPLLQEHLLSCVLTRDWELKWLAGCMDGPVH